MPTLLWDVRQGLVDQFTAGLSVPVINGPVAQSTMPKVCVLVGTDGGEFGTGEGTADGEASRQVWDTFTGPRAEDGEIACSVWGWSGDTDLTALRVTVQDVFAQIDALLLADLRLGGVLPQSGYVHITELRRQEWQRTKGCSTRIAFTVSLYTLVGE